MPYEARTLADAAAAVARHASNSHTVNVDQAATRAVEQHAARDTQSQDSPGGQAPQQG